LTHTVVCGNIGIVDVFRSCDLDLDPMTFIYKLDPYWVKIGLHRMCKYELPSFYVKAFESYRLTDISTYIYRQTDRQTDEIDRNDKARRFAGAQKPVKISQSYRKI